MTETSRGVGRVVVLVLFTVLFVAAWRSDRAGSDRSDAEFARRPSSRRTHSTIVASAESLGAALPYHAAGRLAPADQTNGLTLHTDCGVSAALSRAVPVLPTDHSAPTVAENAIGSALGAQLIGMRIRAAGQPIRFPGAAAILSGSWYEARALSFPAAMNHSRAESDGTGAIDKANAEALNVTARVLR